MRKMIFLLVLLGAALPGFTQVNKWIRQGNALYAQGRYAAAAQHYQQALKEAPDNAVAQYNEASALLQQGRLADARKALESAIRNFERKDARANAFYNTGNSYLQEQKYEEAINAYKQALRQNPGDADAKYNLSYALEKLKQQQQQQQQQQKNKDQKEDQKDKKDQQKQQQEAQKDQKNQQGPQQQQQQGKDQQDQKPQPQPGGMSRQQAENILNALQQEERKVQGRLRQEKGAPVRQDKDW